MTCLALTPRNRVIARLPILLALDTATEMCSVALVRDGAIDELSECAGQTHSERILPMIDGLLARHRLTLADCDAIAFGAGPGSFTGLRIACGVAQGLAWGADKLVLAVGNLAALALRGSDHLGLSLTAAPRVIAVAIDARLGECYWALFESIDGRLQERSAPALAAADELAALLALGDIELLVGNATSAFPQLRGIAPSVLPLAAAGAGAIARLAQIDWAAGRAVRAAAAAPVYVRERVALTIDERRALADTARGQAIWKRELALDSGSSALASGMTVAAPRGGP